MKIGWKTIAKVEDNEVLTFDKYESFLVQYWMEVGCKWTSEGMSASAERGIHKRNFNKELGKKGVTIDFSKA